MEYILKNRVNYFRKFKHLSQDRLAFLCGVSQNTISSIETYQYYPSGTLCAILCKVLDVDFDDLFFLIPRGCETRSCDYNCSDCFLS